VSPLPIGHPPTPCPAGAIVSFATGVKCGDTLVSTWCGTDYAHPLARSCSCYIQTQYEFVRQAIADPDVRCVLRFECIGG